MVRHEEVKFRQLYNELCLNLEISSMYFSLRFQTSSPEEDKQSWAVPAEQSRLWPVPGWARCFQQSSPPTAGSAVWPVLTQAAWLPIGFLYYHTDSLPISIPPRGGADSDSELRITLPPCICLLLVKNDWSRQMFLFFFPPPKKKSQKTSSSAWSDSFWQVSS